MNISLNKSTGVKLLTQGKMCEEDIRIIPALQSKAITENGTYTADEGYAGLGEVEVNIDIPEAYSISGIWAAKSSITLPMKMIRQALILEYAQCYSSYDGEPITLSNVAVLIELYEEGAYIYFPYPAENSVMGVHVAGFDIIQFSMNGETQAVTKDFYDAWLNIAELM